MNRSLSIELHAADRLEVSSCKNSTPAFGKEERQEYPGLVERFK